MDDCGTDHSMEIAEKLVAEYDGQIEFRIIHHEHNRGLSAARNTGTNAATGDYVFYLDSDDFINAQTIDTLYDAFSLYHNIGFTSILPYSYPTGAKTFLEKWKHEGNEIKVINYDNFNISFLRQDVCHTAWGKLFPVELIKTTPFKEGRNNEDTRFYFDLARIIEQKQLCIVELPNEFYAYRDTPNSICSNKKFHLEELRNLVDIKKEAWTEDVRQFAAQKAFLVEYNYLIQNGIKETPLWLFDDFKKYSVKEVWNYYHSKKTCIKFAILKTPLLRKLYINLYQE